MTISSPSRLAERVRTWWALRLREKPSSWDLAVATAGAVVTLAAFLINMGWFRFILLGLMIPPIFLGFYLVLSMQIYWRRYQSRVFYAVSISQPLAYILLPDFLRRGVRVHFFSSANHRTRLHGPGSSAHGLRCSIFGAHRRPLGRSRSPNLAGQGAPE